MYIHATHGIKMFHKYVMEGLYFGVCLLQFIFHNRNSEIVPIKNKVRFTASGIKNKLPRYAYS